MLNIRKSVAAEDDLLTIWLYGYQQWGEEQADRYFDELEHALFLLATQPHLASLRQDLALAVRTHPHKDHLIVYQAFDEYI